MNWINILKNKRIDTYDEYIKERKRLEQEMDRNKKDFMNARKGRQLTEDEVEEYHKISEPFFQFMRKYPQYESRRQGLFDQESERELMREMRERGASRRRSKGKKQKRTKFKVQRGSGQSKSERRSGGRDDSKQFRRL